MRKLYKGIILLLLTAMLLSMAACGADIPNMMDDGANRFGAGKDEENYSMKNSGALLESLIDNYSGSYQMPVGTKMDDQSYEDAKKKVQGDQPTPGETTPDGETLPTVPAPEIPEVADWDDFLRVFHDAYLATEETVQFRLVNGFTVDLYVDLQKSFNQLQREDPIYASCVKQWSWGNQGDEYLLQITYTMDVDELIARKAATTKLVDEAVAKLDTVGKTDYELVCAVNEYLCDVAYYPSTKPYAPETHTAHGALADGVAVCEGYACAAKLMLNKLGIRCDIQVGTCTNGEGHAWNLVELDGQWYQMDVTWNDQSASRDDYLLVTDDYMLKSRTWEFSEYPTCASEPYKP